MPLAFYSSLQISNCLTLEEKRIKGFPPARDLEFINVKLLFQCTLAICCSELNLPAYCWFQQPCDIGEDREQSMMIEVQSKREAKAEEKKDQRNYR